MKAHTSDYKDNVRLFGRELDSIITYTLNGEQIELGTDDLNSVTPHYEGAILKSVMRQLDIDSNVEIPVGTILNYQFGVKINGVYEYINFGDYVVNTIEKQEDVSSYKIVCYDKMLYSMVDYESTGITYPATVRDYIDAVATKIGLTFKNANDTFANYNRIIDHELYLDADGNSLGYTFRDVLDELAQVTASTICINQEDGELEIRYINDTGDTINEEFLKDVNVNFGEKYGPVNSIVLSRASEADNVYLQDDESVAENGLCEIKIKENQIMNFNDRSDYLPDILEVLDGLEYYLNDFSSTGITYLNLCDRYNVQIGENTYSCIMFNDEINITQGLEEIVFTELPEESETDYKKADKTDRKINQTYIIVDKQNQTITSLANEVGQYDNRITTVEQDVNTIKQTAISYEDLKRSTKSVNMLHIENAVPNYPLKFSIKNASVLFPQINLYPGSSTIPEYRHLVLVVDKTRNLSDEARIVELPVKNLYAQDDVYDEFVVEKNRAKLIHRLILNQGELQPLQQEFVEDLGEIDIELFEGDNYIYLYSLINDGAIYEIDYTIPSEFTDTFATEVYVNSSIEQTANQILLQVNEKVDEDEIIAKLNVAVEDGQGIVELKGNTVTIDSDNFNLDADGTINAINGNFSGTITSSNINNNNAFVVNEQGNVTIRDDGSSYWGTANMKLISNNFESELSSNHVRFDNKKNSIHSNLYSEGINFTNGSAYINVLCDENSSGSTSTFATYIEMSDSAYHMWLTAHLLRIHAIETDLFTNNSLEERKKNFEKLTNAKEILKNTDIYKYNFKEESEDTKKHIGFVIGDNFNYSQDITSAENNGADVYAMVSVLWQVVKEQQEEIDELKKLIKESDK